MFDDQFRARFARHVRPLARRLVRAGATPNQITVAAFAVATASAAALALGYPHTALGLWLLSRLGDGIDGAVAREGGLSTPFGGFLDITLDMAAYSAMIVGFAWLYPALGPAWLAILAGYVVVITTTLALSDAAGVMARRVSTTDRTFQFTRGLTEAGETNVMYVLWVLLPEHVWWLVWLWAAAVWATGVQRTYLAWRVLR